MSKEKAQKFTKLHKFLFTDENYKFMKAKSKLLYAIITERQNLSAYDVKSNKDQSQFLDENKRLFSIYSNFALANLLNVSEPTIINLKKELIKNDLLEEIRVANSCNRLYPKKPYDEYFYANDLDEFYRLPHAIFENPYYKSLSADSIIAYSIYLSRYEYSLYKNNFYDNDNKIYCVLTNEELASLLNMNRKKIAKLKKELINCQLLIVKPSIRADSLYVNLPKPSHDKELKKRDIGNLKKGTLGTKKRGHWELKKRDTSNTDLSNTDLSNTDLSNTTTKKTNDFEETSSKKIKNTSSSSDSIKNDKTNELLNRVKIDFDIKITKNYQSHLLTLFKLLPFEVIEYAIEYCSIYGNNPKTYLLTVLNNWVKANVKTVEEAKGYKMNSNTTKNKTSKEMTPKWLKDRENNDLASMEKETQEKDENLEADREEFIQYLKERWGD